MSQMGKKRKKGPLEIYQIDHTVMDVYIVDRKDEHPLKFPIVDRFSGQVIAIPKAADAPEEQKD